MTNGAKENVDKLIQYMACGKPVIGSAYGANKDIVKHGITGYLATSESDWIEYARYIKQSK